MLLLKYIRITINNPVMRNILSILLLSTFWQGASQVVIDVSNDSTTVSVPFYSGLENYASFRIPALVNANNVLVAFSEGRKNSSSDFGDIDLVYRRSLDEGKTWEPLKILYDKDTLAVQNPVPIYDNEKQTIVLLFNTTGLNEHDIKNKDYAPELGRRAYVTVSINDGIRWKPPVEITKAVKRTDWRWHALGPVHGIQLKNGIYKGRLLAPVSISIGRGNNTHSMALLYSDDHGVHWTIGAVDENLTDEVQSNETTIVELDDGRIYVNTRDHEGGSLDKNRGETYSLDGGLTFLQPVIESDKFPSPIVQASLLRWKTDKGQGKDMLFFSTPNNPHKRENLTIMVSYDEAKSWRSLIKVHHGFSAYSDMVKLNDTTLGVLYETDEYNKIEFRSIRIPGL